MYTTSKSIPIKEFLDKKLIHFKKDEVPGKEQWSFRTYSMEELKAILHTPRTDTASRWCARHGIVKWPSSYSHRLFVEDCNNALIKEGKDLKAIKDALAMQYPEG